LFYNPRTQHSCIDFSFKGLVSGILLRPISNVRRVNPAKVLTSAGGSQQKAVTYS